MPEAVLLSAVRTAIGTSFKGTLRDTSAFDLGTTIVREAVSRSGLDPELFDDVMLGEALAGGGDIARYAAEAAGLTHVPGVAMQRQCATSLTSIGLASGSIIAGMDRAVVAGGTHSSSTSPRMSWRTPGTDDWQDSWMPPAQKSDDPLDMDMSWQVGWGAARLAGISREDQDAWAVRSHDRAIAGIDSGAFVDEIVPIKVTNRDGSVSTFEVDEHPRRGSTVEKLATLKVLHPEIEGFSITAGNASGINDAAAAVVVANSDIARAAGLEPLATVKAWAAVGVPPRETGLSPAPAVRKVLARAGLTLADIDMFEINEAFASVAVAATRELGIDEAKVNPLGSGCSLGHPIAASGARMVTTIVHELRRRGGGYGLAAMCAGGGQAGAIIIKV